MIVEKNSLLEDMTQEELFTQLIGLTELEVIAVVSSPTHYLLSVRSTLAAGICPKCGNKCSKVKSYHTRRVKDMPISGRIVILELEVRQFECECGNYFIEPFQFVRPKKHLTVRYEEYLYDRCKGTEIKYISDKEELDWKTVDELFHYYSARELEERTDWSEVSHLALDEIALRKGHNDYVVVVLDLQSGVILDLLESRDKAFLVNYFRSKGAGFCKQIEVFCSDMWKAYLTCAEEVFCQAVIVADRFHFFSKCQEGVDHARKSFRKAFPKADELKKLKWALLKNPENLTVKERKKLNAAFEKKEYHLLRLTWDARNALRDIFNGPFDRQQAEQLIAKWIEGVRQLKVRYFFHFIDFYHRWKPYILNYFEGKFSTGKLEGTNNKLKLIKRRAFGFLNFDHFRTRAMVEFF